MDAIGELTAPCFNALARLRDAEDVTAPPATVQQRLRGYIDEARAKGRQFGISDRDLGDIIYALVALTDEVALSKPEPLRGHWIGSALQMQYFNENTAGEGFFARLQALRGDRRRADVLRVYYLCLLFGFQGQYSIKGGEAELLRLLEGLRTDVEAEAEIPADLSPAGLPPDEPLSRGSSRNVLLYIALGVFAAAIAVFVGLRLSLNGLVGDVADRVDQLSE